MSWNGLQAMLRMDKSQSTAEKSKRVDQVINDVTFLSILTYCITIKIIPS